MALTAHQFEQFAGTDTRILELIDWTENYLNDNITSIEFASEDASFRRYFRIFHGNHSYIVMDAPTEHMSIAPFSRIAKRLLQENINVPEIFAENHEKGFMLITDFGTTTYLQVLNEKSADQLYSDALDSLIKLQRATITDSQFLPPYDQKLLRSEMDLFPSWFLTKNLNISLNSEISDILQKTFEFVITKALEQPKVWVHLDYHSRNLMYTDQNNPGVLDFQNAVMGPITYDLMSLLRDCYIVWSDEQIKRWIRLYLLKAKIAGLDISFDEREFIRWFDWMGIQRHLKVVGIFSRLNLRDGKKQFMQDIPTVLQYIENVSKKYQELKSLYELILRMK